MVDKYTGTEVDRAFLNKRFLRILAPLLFSLLACEPMIAIGKNEFLILVVLIAILLGPPIYKFIRRMEQILKQEKKDK